MAETSETSTTPATKVGVFSKKAVEAGVGTSYWRTTDGRMVEVVSVLDNPDCCLWSDKEVVGQVTEWVSDGRPSKYSGFLKE